MLTSNPAIPGVAGCWNISRGADSGLITLKQKGASLEGFADWPGTGDAHVAGTASANRVRLP